MSMRIIVLAVISLLFLLYVSACGAEHLFRSREYLPLDTPEAPVINAFQAMKKGDLAKARQQFTKGIRDAKEKRHDFTTDASLKDDTLEILDIRPIPNRPDRMVITLKQSERSFLFFSSSQDLTVFVEHTEEGWKLDSMSAFFGLGSIDSL